MKKSIILLSAIVVSMACGTVHASLLTEINLIDNPGFEAGVGFPWEPQGTATIGISSTAHTGLQSAEVNFPGADGHGIKQVFALDAGDRFQTYTMSASVNHNGQAQMVGYRLGLWEFGPGGIHFHDSDFLWTPGGTSGWQDLSFSVDFTSPDADSLWAVVISYPQDIPKNPGTFLVDDVSLVKAIPEPGTISLVGAMGGALLFIRRRFTI